MSRSPTIHRNHDGPSTDSRRSLDDVFDALAGRRRRETLALLRSHDRGLSESDLATLLVAERADKPLVDVTDSEHQRVEAKLRHADLPKLAAADLIRRDEVRGKVSLGRLGAAAPILDAVGGAEGPGAVDERASPDAVDEVLAALAAERRRIALSVLCEAGELEPAELAERVAQREAGSRDAADSEIASVRASLRHQHLPTLDNAGLVDRAEADETGNDETVVDETDAERETISFDGRAAFDAEWLRIADEARADVSARVRACDCGAFEGCEDLYVVSSTDGLGVEGAVRLRNDGSDDAGESR